MIEAIATYLGCGALLAWKKMPDVVEHFNGANPLGILLGSLFYTIFWLPALLMTKVR